MDYGKAFIPERVIKVKDLLDFSLMFLHLVCKFQVILRFINHIFYKVLHRLIIYTTCPEISKSYLFQEIRC